MERSMPLLVHSETGLQCLPVPELCDVMCRGNTHIQEEGAGDAAISVSLPRGERDAVRYAADGKSLDHPLTIRVMPNTAQVAGEILHVRGTSREPVHIEPLTNDLLGIRRSYGRVRTPMPNGELGPGTPGILTRRAPDRPEHAPMSNVR